MVSFGVFRVGPQFNPRLTDSNLNHSFLLVDGLSLYASPQYPTITTIYNLGSFSLSKSMHNNNGRAELWITRPRPLILPDFRSETAWSLRSDGAVAICYYRKGSGA